MDMEIRLKLYQIHVGTTYLKIVPPPPIWSFSESSLIPWIWYGHTMDMEI